MLNFLKRKKSKTVELKAPITGKVVELSEVPDEVFSQKLAGDGVAIKPENNVVHAPVDGEITQIFPTKHAVGITSKQGVEILIHIGIDTVNMQGEGFTAFVEKGDKVKAGDKLIEFDTAKIEEKAKSTITPVIVTNGDVLESMEKSLGDVTEKEDAVLTLKLK
ncbi:PTS sugar transporter subunit IIA [Thermohalobacter berrensis]|uniref:PTS glucose transporter subunit IIA n=1 Tax=Thermohalobacter berrensis TaxID=99594 RepID=A0A419T9M7_9FIRM|nr:PTS glucose transporter subunit IIA [Thermohalobacter berrensis]RKD34182.1 PTS glucose transporter subunit IIA [Thermohalobacter berrensis]